VLVRVLVGNKLLFSNDHRCKHCVGVFSTSLLFLSVVRAFLQDLANEHATDEEAELIKRALSYDNGSAGELHTRYNQVLTERFGRLHDDNASTEVTSECKVDTLD